MKNNYIKSLLFTGVLACTLPACTDDLELTPKYELTSASVYNDFTNYKSVLAKLYAGYAVTGQKGPDGLADVSGFDEGKSNYIRAYWQLQELSTDEAVIAWNDGTIFDIHDMDWTSNNEYVRMMYDRIYYQISICNEFIRETSDDKLSGRNITGNNLADAKHYRAEVRLLRAMSYWHALDLFGSVPFVTEEDKVGAFFPKQISRQDLFTYVESELKALETELVPARQNEYARADQAAAWTLLTKLYLNAEVYTGTARYTDAITYANKVINAGYALEPEYRKLFLADNNTSNEIIFLVAFDGQKTKTWGGTTFLVHAPIGGNMKAAEFGVNGGWGGLRTTKNIVNLFPDVTGTADKRSMFHSDGQNLEINDIATFTEGYSITKYRNVNSAGQAGSDPSGTHTDTDYPMFRLADVYLMYAEAVLRGGTGGDAATALQYINQLRQRAYGSTAGNITANQMTLDFILDERARELKWEGHRRTDLIRFSRFVSGSYVWPWKGGVKEGRAVEAFRNLYPIPTSDLTANPNLVQNTGY
ncbi:RagB/SusD family nutrient uptake outer membrane protein [Adhaeribacter arboris]|uniref:RagB/SusD family nutrient uptake outer membrane protein n=1 Tax=Adhaeribacter arboris TaxID=2072846 RepID=A0A2T2YFQ4_9BACT|nr:RagB/SusD family nutrient uptake outer membrane protein [Adhaeribacter arboris]PSR54323.1 RagB/SusD family nutrient uptake outer membrane protein [Adhaeribacter arboris]